MERKSKIGNISIVPSAKNLSNAFELESPPPTRTSMSFSRASITASAIFVYISLYLIISACQPDMEVPSHGSFHKQTAVTGPLGQPKSRHNSFTNFLKSSSNSGSHTKSCFVWRNFPFSSKCGLVVPKGMDCAIRPSPNMSITVILLSMKSFINFFNSCRNPW